jgi:hypothetical protein
MDHRKGLPVAGLQEIREKIIHRNYIQFRKLSLDACVVQLKGRKDETVLEYSVTKHSLVCCQHIASGRGVCVKFLISARKGIIVCKALNLSSL